MNLKTPSSSGLIMEGLNVSNAKMTVNLHPSSSRDVRGAVLRALSSLLFRFNDEFDGAVLAYEFNILDENPKILSGVHPYFSVRLDAKLLVFSPKPDMLIEGKVDKVKQKSIRVKILGFSSAVIAVGCIRDEFQYKNKHGKGLFISKSHKKHGIKAGTWIRLLVLSVNQESMRISGSLLPPQTGNVVWLDKQMEDVSIMDGSNKRRGDGEEPVMQEPSGTSAAVFSTVSDLSINKSKKRRTREDS